jgi:hypothetical protein
METFSLTFHVSNKDKFSDEFFKKYLIKLRKIVADHMLRCNENDFVDLDTFNRKYVKDMAKTRQMAAIVSDELKQLGWNTLLGFGETGLYIYSTDEPPASAY